MTKRKSADPEALRFARMALIKFTDTSPGVGQSCAFMAGFALALGYVRLVGLPDAAEQEAVSAAAVQLAEREELEP